LLPLLGEAQIVADPAVGGSWEWDAGPRPERSWATPATRRVRDPLLGRVRCWATAATRWGRQLFPRQRGWGTTAATHWAATAATRWTTTAETR